MTEAVADTVAASDADVVVIGASFSGLYMLHRLRELGVRARVLEAAPTVLVHPSCNSWYNGGNVPGKKLMYMGSTGGIPECWRRCDEIAATGYTGFKLR